MIYGIIGNEPNDIKNIWILVEDKTQPKNWDAVYVTKNNGEVEKIQKPANVSYDEFRDRIWENIQKTGIKDKKDRKGDVWSIYSRENGKIDFDQLDEKIDAASATKNANSNPTPDPTQNNNAQSEDQAFRELQRQYMEMELAKEKERKEKEEQAKREKATENANIKTSAVKAIEEAENLLNDFDKYITDKEKLEIEEFIRITKEALDKNDIEEIKAARETLNKKITCVREEAEKKEKIDQARKKAEEDQAEKDAADCKVNGRYTIKSIAPIFAPAKEPAFQVVTKALAAGACIIGAGVAFTAAAPIIGIPLGMGAIHFLNEVYRKWQNLGTRVLKAKTAKVVSDVAETISDNIKENLNEKKEAIKEKLISGAVQNVEDNGKNK